MTSPCSDAPGAYWVSAQSRTDELFPSDGVGGFTLTAANSFTLGYDFVILESMTPLATAAGARVDFTDGSNNTIFDSTFITTGAVGRPVTFGPAGLQLPAAWGFKMSTSTIAVKIHFRRVSLSPEG